ncbi:MAG: aminotransferase class V-fold PLP-dependent enzyme [Clostridia bacterium]|nr:aminotransferase class V-fold PLP-dependent enzyme [Clostridia bacterium]
MNRTIYLDNAATSYPKPLAVLKEAERCLRYYCVNTGRSSHKKSRYANETVFAAREATADFFGIDNPERIAFTQNTTAALNQGLYGALRAGDKLVISSMEHNSILRPAENLRRQGVDVRIVKADKNGEVSFKEIEPHLGGETKMVALIHASNVTGRVNDIEAIGMELKKRNILFLVDAAQSAGCVPIDVKKQNIDILCFPGHKGLLGPPGTGGIYVADGINPAPLMQGGTGSLSESLIQPSEMPDLLESGTPNVLGIACLSKSIKYVKNRFAEISEREKYLSGRLCDSLKNIKGIEVLGRNGGKNTGIVCVKLEGIAPAAAAFYLDRDFGIATRAGFHCAYLAAKTLGVEKEGSLRFSVGPFNTKDDIDIASFAMKKIMTKY